MKSLITAAFASSLASVGNEPPAEIVYFPEGEHTISATVDGKPKTIVVKVPPGSGAAIAAAMQVSLDRRAAANVRPWFDFEHKRGAASALPKAFRYEPGKGVMCLVDWTAAGRSAIEGRDYSYFSPEFYLDDDGVPAGLPERGPLGALVNEPAFRSIPRIAASDAGTDDNPTDTFYRDLARDRGLGQFPDEQAAKLALVEENPRLYEALMREQTADADKAGAAAGDPAANLADIEARAQNLVASGAADDINQGIAATLAADAGAYERYGVALAHQAEVARRNSVQAASTAVVDQVRIAASGIIAAGVVTDPQQAIEQALAADGSLYGRYIGAGCPDLAQCAVNVRKETMREIERMRDGSGPSPKEQLEEIAAGLLESGKASDLSDAQIKACEQRPDLYQAMMDAGREKLGC